MKKVLLDTNFLMVPFQFGVDVFDEMRSLLEGEFELLTSSEIVRELERISAGASKDASAARSALRLLKEKGVRVIQSRTSADDWLVEYGQENNAVVCTNDSELLERLEEAGVSRIRLRGRSRLQLN